MRILLLIGTGSFIGGIFRYALVHFVQSRATTAFPFGTLAVNLVGCFVIGLVFALSEHSKINEEWRMFLAAGICGGFTTFSAFSLETFGMLRTGMAWYACLYILVSVLVGVLATIFGYRVFNLF